MKDGEETITLKEHFLALRDADKTALQAALAAQKEATAAALASAEKAVAVAEKNAGEWRAGANEWRAAMSDRERSFMPRAEFEQYKAATEKILNIQQGKGMGRMELWGIFVVGVGVIGGLIAIFYRLNG